MPVSFLKVVPESPYESAGISQDSPVSPFSNQDATLEPSLERSGSITSTSKTVNKLSTFIVWSIFNLLFVPFGILCCYFSYRVHQYKKQNLYILADKWSKRTFVLNTISTLLMFGVIITAVMLNYDYEQRHPSSSVNQTYTTAAYIPWQPGR